MKLKVEVALLKVVGLPLAGLSFLVVVLELVHAGCFVEIDVELTFVVTLLVRVTVELEVVVVLGWMVKVPLVPAGEVIIIPGRVVVDVNVLVVVDAGGGKLLVFKMDIAWTHSHTTSDGGSDSPGHGFRGVHGRRDLHIDDSERAHGENISEKKDVVDSSNHLRMSERAIMSSELAVAISENGVRFVHTTSILRCCLLREQQSKCRSFRPETAREAQPNSSLGSLVFL